MAEFLEAYKFSKIAEGGYSNRAADKGGETYAGISRKWHPTWPGWAIIDRLKPLKQGQIIKNNVELESALRIFYQQNFWTPMKGNSMDSQRIATFTYDWMLTSWDDAIKALQKAVEVPMDSKIGPATLAAVNAANEETLLQKLKGLRKQFYISLVRKDPSQKPNLNGWLNRVDMF